MDKTAREVSSSIYAWDLHDEGVEAILDNLQGMAQVNSIYLIALMHKERHPWPNTDDFPHNPARKEYITEDSRAYWAVEESRYGRIKPQTPDNFLKGTDWMELLVRHARKRGMKTGVELSHTMLGSDRLAQEFPDVRQMDIYGKPLATTHIGEHHYVSCMNNPDFQEYVQNLYMELAAGYDIDYILNCNMPYPLPAEYLLTEYEDDLHPLDWFLHAPTGSGCFCPACKARAKAQDFDLDAVQDTLLRAVEGYEQGIDPRVTNATLLELLLETPVFMDWIRFRCDSVTEYYRKLCAASKRVRSTIDNRLNLYVTSHPEYAGLQLKALADIFDSVRVCCYTEHLGRPELNEHKRRVLNNTKRAFGDKHLLSTIAVLSGSTPQSIEAGMRASADCGYTSFALGHYDGATFEMLRAVGDTLDKL